MGKEAIQDYIEANWDELRTYFEDTHGMIENSTKQEKYEQEFYTWAELEAINALAGKEEMAYEAWKEREL